MSGVRALSGQQDRSECWEQAQSVQGPLSVPERGLGGEAAPVALPTALSPASGALEDDRRQAAGARLGAGRPAFSVEVQGQKQPTPSLRACTPLGH